MAQERVGRDPQLEHVAALLDARVQDLALEVDVLGLAGREGREVVGAGQRRRAGVQQPAVERVGPPQRAAVLERRAGAAREDPVAVGARRGVAARVEPVGRRRRLAHRRRPAAAAR